MSVPLNDNEPLQAPPTSSTGSAQEVLQWEKDAKQSVVQLCFLQPESDPGKEEAPEESDGDRTWMLWLVGF